MHARRMMRTAATGLLALTLAATSAQADPQLQVLEERAFQQAAAQADASIVRIETIGGLDVVGEMVASSGPTTGVIVAADGWIITSSFNFAARPTSVFVTTVDGRRHAATIAGRDESRRTTLLKIPVEGLKPIVPAPREELRVGQWAIALGRTFDPEFPNLSVGIVSALDRMSGRAIQTDAKTSPVNYGGALVDIEGRCLGIVVPMSASGDEVTAGVDYYDSGIGFAVPIADVLAVLDRLQEGTVLKPGKLGILYTPKGLDDPVVIERVNPRSPAERAGLQKGDTIIGAGGRPVSRAAELKQALGPLYGGDAVTLTVRRGESTLDVPVELTDEIVQLTPGLLGLLFDRARQDPPVARVFDVIPDSPAAGAGVAAGDILQSINGTPVVTLAEAQAVMLAATAGDQVTLEVRTGDETRTLTAELTAWPLETPARIPAQAIPAPPDLESPTVRRGRIVDQVVGDDRRFWAFVPEHYHPDYAYGLVVWLHPESGRREAETLAAWRAVCEERGLILVGPPAGKEAWSPEDVPFVLAIIEKLQKDYTIDERRVMLAGEKEGAMVALVTALQQPDRFAGLSMLGVGLPEPVAMVMEIPVPLHLSAFEGDRDARDIERTAELLRGRSRSVVARRWPGDGADGLTASAAEELGRWIELLGAL
ncbi:MAG: PDZ domain-containing protein [Planctomyces sp.]|nr:PDZ domain-containing protein [Planctomyces sp.]